MTGGRVVEGSVSVYRNEDSAYSMAVNPFEGGTQIVSVIADSSAPTGYDYSFDGTAAGQLELTEDGGVTLKDSDGAQLANVAAPWAVDANGASVPTRFILTGENTITQVVDHRAEGVAYPVTADPRIFSCDGGLSWCVKFTKSETKAINKKGQTPGVSIYALAIYICGRMPHPAITGGCIVGVTAVGSAARNAFKSAVKEGKCIELHFWKTNIVPWRWKKEGC